MYHPAADSGKSAQGGGNIHLFDDLLSKHESANGQFFEEDSQAGQDPDGVNEEFGEEEVEEPVENTDESLNKMQLLLNRVKQGVFGALYVMAKETQESHLSHLVFSTIEFILFLAFPFHKVSHFPWNSKYMNLWIEFINIFEVETYLVLDGIWVDLMYIVTFLSVSITLGLALFVAYTLSGTRSKFQSVWILRILRSVAPFFVTTMYIPLLKVFVSVFHCKFGNGCWEGFGLIVSMSALLIGILFVALANLVAATFYDPDPTSVNWGSRPHSRGDLMYLAFTTILTIVFGILGKSAEYYPFLVSLLLVGGLCTTYLFTMYIPYYSFTYSCIRVGQLWVFSWASICLLIAKLYGDYRSDAAGSILFFLGCPFVIFTGVMTARMRRDWIARTPVHKLNSAYEVEIKIRFYLSVMTPYQQVHGTSFEARLEDKEFQTRLKHAEKMLSVALQTPHLADSSILHLFAFQFYFTHLRDVATSQDMLARAEQLHPKVDELFIIFRSRRQAEAQANAIGAENVDTADVILQMSIKKYKKEANYYTERALKNEELFWNELLKSVPNLDKLHKAGMNFNRSLALAEENMKALMKLNASHPDPEVLRMYGSFLYDSCIDKVKGERLMKRASEIEHYKSKAAAEEEEKLRLQMEAAMAKSHAENGEETESIMDAKRHSQTNYSPRSSIASSVRGTMSRAPMRLSRRDSKHRVSMSQPNTPGRMSSRQSVSNPVTPRGGNRAGTLHNSMAAVQSPRHGHGRRPSMFSSGNTASPTSSMRARKPSMVVGAGLGSPSASGAFSFSPRQSVTKALPAAGSATSPHPSRHLRSASVTADTMFSPAGRTGSLKPVELGAAAAALGSDSPRKGGRSGSFDGGLLLLGSGGASSPRAGASPALRTQTLQPPGHHQHKSSAPSMHISLHDAKDSGDAAAPALKPSLTHREGKRRSRSFSGVSGLQPKTLGFMLPMSPRSPIGSPMPVVTRLHDGLPDAPVISSAAAVDTLSATPPPVPADSTLLDVHSLHAAAAAAAAAEHERKTASFTLAVPDQKTPTGGPGAFARRLVTDPTVAGGRTPKGAKVAIASTESGATAAAVREDSLSIGSRESDERSLAPKSETSRGTGTTATSTNTVIDGENLEALFGSKAAHNGNTGLKTLRRTFQITIIVSMALAVASFISMDHTIAQYKDNVKDLRESTLRQFYSVTLVQTLRSLELVNRGVLSGDREAEHRERLRHFANHLEGAHYTLRKRVTALSDDHQKLYNIPSIPLQERRDKVDELFKVQREWNLAHAVNTLAAKSRIVSYYPLGQLRADQDENVYFVTANGMNSILTALNASSFLYHDAAEHFRAAEATLNVAFFAVGIGFLLCTFTFVFAPTIVRVAKNNEKVLRLFLDLPRPVVRKFHSRVVTRLTAMEQRDGMTADAAAVKADANSSDEEEDEEDEKETAAKGNGGGLTGFMRSPSDELEEQQQAAAEAAKRASKRPGVKSEKQFKDPRQRKQRTHRDRLRTFVKVSALVLLCILYFVMSFIWSSKMMATAAAKTAQLPSFSSPTAAAEINYAGMRQVIARQAFFYLRERVVAAAVPATNGQFPVETNPANSGYNVLEVNPQFALAKFRWLRNLNAAVIYGNAAYKMDGSLRRYGQLDDIYLSNACLDPAATAIRADISPDRPTKAAADLNCTGFYDGLIAFGLVSTMEEFFKVGADWTDKSLVPTNSSSPADYSSLGQINSTFTNPKWQALEMLDGVYMAEALEATSEIYTAELLKLSDDVVNGRRTLMIIFVVLLPFLYWGFYSPLVDRLNDDIRRTRAMLLVIPLEVIKRMDNVKTYIFKRAESRRMRNLRKL